VAFLSANWHYEIQSFYDRPVDRGRPGRNRGCVHAEKVSGPSAFGPPSMALEAAVRRLPSAVCVDGSTWVATQVL